jgi:hypothetical protein
MTSKYIVSVAVSSSAPLTVDPGEGQTGVRLDAGVILSFTEPVDRSVVERDFHLISERAMADSLCPVSNAMSHGNMMISMMDSTKMHHLDLIHSTRGKFVWNADNTQCTFRPDSMMAPKMQYMIHFGPDMVGMMQTTFGGMEMMSGHGSGVMSNEMMRHFSTLDTASTGSGHAGHH